MRLLGLIVAFSLLSSLPVSADTPDSDTSWNDVVSDGDSIIFGRFTGKFESSQFTSKRVRLRELTTGKVRFLEVDDGLGYIAEKVPPGTYQLEGVEAVYNPRYGRIDHRRRRPIRQRYGVNPKTGDASAALIVVPKDRPVYIGTIEAESVLDGVVYRGHQLRIHDEFEEAYDRLGVFYPALARSLERSGIFPVSHFMLKPSPKERGPLERVVGLEDPVTQARQYIAEGKFEQAINWLETFMPTTDEERSETRLLVGEALLADKRYSEAIDVLGEVLLADPKETRALRLLARAHAFNEDVESAESLYRALAEAIPEDAEAHLHLGYLHALKRQSEPAKEHFRLAFQTDFDYLLHDIAPFYLALRTVGEDAEYEPARIVRYDVAPPRGMDSRRASETSSISVLIDHEGKVVAAHISAESTGSAPQMMVSLVRARYMPASLNGIPIPSLLTLGRPQPNQ